MNHAEKADRCGLVARAPPEATTVIIAGAIVGEGHSGNEIKYSQQPKSEQY